MTKISIISSNINFKGGASIATKRLINIFKKNFYVKIFFPRNNFVQKLKYYIARSLINVFIGKSVYLNSLNIFSKIDYKKINSELVNLNWIGGETISLKNISKIKVPIIWTLHDMWALNSTEHFLDFNEENKYSKKHKMPILKKYIFNQKKKFYKKNLHLVTNSKWLEKIAKKSLLTKNQKIQTIYNPIETNYWKKKNKLYSIKKLNLNNNRGYILMGAHGGLANFRKGGDLFIESLKKINYLKDEYEIIILGQKENYIDSINGFKFNFRKFEKKISRQILYQSVTNLVIIPSRAESIPQFAVESIICQNPVVSFKIGGMNEIIEHKKNGYLAKPFNINDFSKGIDYCLTKIDKKNLKKFSNKLKVQFGQENINKSYNNLFNSILSKS